MRRQLRPALGMLAVFTLITGLIYPLLVTGFGQVLFNHKANGSLIERNGQAIGSELIGQDFSGAGYFHPRPSASGYANQTDGEPIASYGSNLGPTSKKFLYGLNDDGTPYLDSDGNPVDGVQQRVAAYRQENGLSSDTAVPVDAVTASASGLDPEISVANARLQAPRVANARGVPVATVLTAIDQHTTGRTLGILGEPGVNVLELNLALDQR